MPKKKKRWPTKCTRPATFDKGRRAYELRMVGYALREIGDELGMTASGVHELLHAFEEALPRLDATTVRAELLARLDMVTKRMVKDLNGRDPHVRAAAARAISNIARNQAVIAGVVRLAPPIVVMPPSASNQLDLARIPISILSQLEHIKRQLQAPALEAHGEDVTNEQSHERDDARTSGTEP